MWKRKKFTDDDFKLPISDIHLKKWEIGHILYQLDKNLQAIKQNKRKLKNGEEFSWYDNELWTEGIQNVISYLTDPELRYEILHSHMENEKYQKAMEREFCKKYDGEFVECLPLKKYLNEEGINIPLESDKEEQFYDMENIVKSCED